MISSYHRPKRRLKCIMPPSRLPMRAVVTTPTRFSIRKRREKANKGMHESIRTPRSVQILCLPSHITSPPPYQGPPRPSISIHRRLFACFPSIIIIIPASLRDSELQPDDFRWPRAIVFLIIMHERSLHRTAIRQRRSTIG